MNYRRISDGSYPFTEDAIRASELERSLPVTLSVDDFNYLGYEEVVETDRPDFNPVTQKLEEGIPVQLDDAWTQVWNIMDVSQEEQAITFAAQRSLLLAGVQNRLDSFAQERNYANILSAATYSTSTIDKFRTEGQYAVESRDATWIKCYEILAEVFAGTRPIPKTYADIEGDLPSLVWPTEPPIGG